MEKQRDHSALAVVLVCGGLAAVHSLLAARPVKDAFERVAGQRNRDGLYRFTYVILAIVESVWAVRWFRRQPDRELYEVKSPASWLLRAVQFASLSLLLPSVRQVGLTNLLGLRQVTAFLLGRDPQREPEAQGPVIQEDGAVDARGAFGRIRHPENLSFVGLFWAFPRMTVNRLTLAVLMTVYAIVGSWHEDARLRRAYGTVYDRYLRRVPMLVPRRKQASRSQEIPAAVSLFS